MTRSRPTQALPWLRRGLHTATLVLLSLVNVNTGRAQTHPSLQCRLTRVNSSSGVAAEIQFTNVGSQSLTVSGEPISGEPTSLLVASRNRKLEPRESLECVGRYPIQLQPGQTTSVRIPIEGRFDLAPSTVHFVALASPIELAVDDDVQHFTPDCGTFQFTTSNLGSSAQPLVNATVNACNSSRKTVWRNAQRVARYITQPSIAHAVSANVGGPAHWVLGSFLERSPTLTQTVANSYESRINEIHANLADDEGAGVKCIEGTNPIRCSSDDTFATAGVNINLCSSFFDDLDILGQTATLVHEITHVEHDTRDNDNANGTAHLSDIANPRGIFPDVQAQRNSSLVKICDKLNDAAQAACVATGVFTGTVPPWKCDDEFNCSQVPRDIAGVWEAITAALVLDHFDGLYRHYLGRPPTVGEFESELRRIHAGESPKDEFSAVAWYVQRSVDAGAPGSASFARAFTAFRQHADYFGFEDLDSLLNSALSNDPFAAETGLRVEDFLRFMERGLPASGHAGDYFRALLAAKVMVTFGS